MKWVIELPDNYVKLLPFKRGSIAESVVLRAVNDGHEQMTPEYTKAELGGITDALKYLLGAELLPENGYTDDAVNALNSALEKTTGFLLKVRIAEVVSEKLKDCEQQGRDVLQDSDVIDIMEECQRRGVYVTRAQLAEFGLEEDKE